jgi:hypothetical protein
MQGQYAEMAAIRALQRVQSTLAGDVDAARIVPQHWCLCRLTP